MSAFGVDLIMPTSFSRSAKKRSESSASNSRHCHRVALHRLQRVIIVPGEPGIDQLARRISGWLRRYRRP